MLSQLNLICSRIFYLLFPVYQSLFYALGKRLQLYSMRKIMWNVLQSFAFPDMFMDLDIYHSSLKNIFMT